MSFVALVSDSTAGVSEEFVQEYNIRIVPLYINIGDEVCRDGLDIGPEEMYERLPSCDPLPTTSQPSVGDFAAVYKQLAEDGARAIVSVHLSSGISGTVNSARLAAEQLDGVPVEIVDSKTAGPAHLMAVEAGAKAIAQGQDFEDVVDVIRGVFEQQRTVFVVDTLEYLYKGGRIGGASALLGSLLQFKPLLHFVDGEIDALERVRTSNRSLKRSVEVMEEWLGSQGKLHAMVVHAACPDRADAIVDILEERLDLADIRVGIVPTVLGVHTGNGTIGLCCYPATETDS